MRTSSRIRGAGSALAPRLLCAFGSQRDQSELVVCMMEVGYQTTQASKALRDSVGLVLRKDGERFRKVGV